MHCNVLITKTSEHYILYIANVTEDDSRLRFACAYKGTGSTSKSLLSGWVKLYFFIQCSVFYPEDEIELLFSSDGLEAVLYCKYPASTASPRLRWLEDVTPISDPVISTVSATTTISWPRDIAEEYVCIADTLPVTLPPCSVMPANVSIEANVSPQIIEATSGSSVNISCYNVVTFIGI